MNYQAELNRLIAALGGDKNTNPKWRNKIVARLEEIEAVLHKLDSREISKAELGNLEQHAPESLSMRGHCICPNGDIPPYNPSCPKHGM